MNTETTDKKLEVMQFVRNELPTFQAILALNTQKDTDNATMVRQEIQYLEQIGLQNQAIYECEPITIVMAVKSVLKKNLTLDPDAGLVYVKTRNYKAGTDSQGKDIWKKALDITETANGKISVARQCGRVLDVDRPKVIKNAEGRVTEVVFKYLVPTVDLNGQPSARWKEIEFDESDFERWKKYSHKENRRKYDNAYPATKQKMTAPDENTLNYANPLYTSWKGGIDPEFARAKSIVHGLKKLGTNPHEGRARQIVQETEKKFIVDESASLAAVAEDDTYIQHEDITTDQSNNSVEATQELIPEL